MFAEPLKTVIAEKIALTRKQSRGLCHYQVRPYRAVWRSHRRKAAGRPADRTNNETHSHALASVATFGIWHSLGDFSDQR